MDQLLEKILSSDVLTEETKQELRTGIKEVVEEAVKIAEAKAAVEVQHRLTEQFIEYRETLLEAIDEKLNEDIQKEFDELRQDIEQFRDLEKEYAEKLVEAKQEMAKELAENLDDLKDKLNSYLEVVLEKEIEELRHDIEDQRQNRFGRKIYEAMKEEFEKNYFDHEQHEDSISSLQAKLEESVQAAERAQRKVAKMEREKIMETVLKPLNGKQKDVMEAILSSYNTDRLQEAYDLFVGKVIKESEVKDSDKMITEQTEKKEIKGVVKTGDVIMESVEDSQTRVYDAERIHLRRLAGLKI